MHFHLLPAEGSLLQQVEQQIGSRTLPLSSPDSYGRSRDSPCPGGFSKTPASPGTQLEQDYHKVLRHWYQQPGLELLDPEEEPVHTGPPQPFARQLLTQTPSAGCQQLSGPQKGNRIPGQTEWPSSLSAVEHWPP